MRKDKQRNRPVMHSPKSKEDWHEKYNIAMQLYDIARKESNRLSKLLNEEMNKGLEYRLRLASIYTILATPYEKKGGEQ